MCCCETRHGRHGNAGSKVCMGFWSKERKINALEDELKSMEENSADLKHLIEELKAEK